MEELPRNIELLIISTVIKSVSWVRTNREYDKINNKDVKFAIKDKFTNTDIKRWKKEYTKYLHKTTKLRIEIHRCVNMNNFNQEFDVKIKKPQNMHWLKQIIEVVEAELGTVLLEVAATRDDE